MRTSVVSGAYGPFEGACSDEVVFGRYRQAGDWAPEMLGLLETLLTDGCGTLLDVGANIGLVSIPLAQRTAVTGHCFEPSPQNFALLERNLARHRMQARLRAHPFALAAESGTARMVLEPTNSGDHHMQRQDASCPEGMTVVVATRRLDDLLDGQPLTPPVIMKVDTQGAEVDVLRGASATLDRVDHLLVEYWPQGLARMGRRPADLQAELRRFTYGCLVSQEGHQPRMEPTDQLLERLSFFSDVDPGFFDLLLSRVV